MSVRKREWTNANGVQTRWLVDYRDQGGTRRTKQFLTKREATAFAAQSTVDVKAGIHVPDAVTTTIAEAANIWIETGKAAELERTTLDQRRQHIERHILPFIGAMRLNKLNVAAVMAFQDRLRADGRSPALIKKVTTSLGGILANAARRGLVASNPVGSLPRSHNGRKKRLQAGIDIPLPSEVQALIAALNTMPRWRPILLTAIFTGMRASELRGLRWSDVDLRNAVVHVRQRLDRYNVQGLPKSDAGTRTIPIPAPVCNMLREWRLACPKSELDLVFPTGAGRPESLGNIIRRGLWPAMIAAGVTVPAANDDDEPKVKYTGLHSLRHWYASWLINRKADGGCELPLKTVQGRLGHSSVVMTADVYGHLFPAESDETLTAAAELLFAVPDAT